MTPCRDVVGGRGGCEERRLSFDRIGSTEDVDKQLDGNDDRVRGCRVDVNKEEEEEGEEEYRGHYSREEFGGGKFRTCTSVVFSCVLRSVRRTKGHGLR